MLPEPLQSIARTIYAIGGGQLCLVVISLPAAGLFLLALATRNEPKLLGKIITLLPTAIFLLVAYFVYSWATATPRSPEQWVLVIVSGIVFAAVYLGILAAQYSAHLKEKAGKTIRQPAMYADYLKLTPEEKAILDA